MFHSSDMWDLWWQSGMNMENPIRISYSTTEIYKLIQDPIKRDNMMRAYQEYFAMKQQKQNAFIEQQALGQHDITYALFSTSINMNTGHMEYKYIVPPTMVPLAANTSTVPVGPSGGCDHLTKAVVQPAHTETRYYYYVSQFQCQRSPTGSVVSVLYFDANTWLNTVRPRDDCTLIAVNHTDYTNHVYHKYMWSCTGNTCSGYKVEGYAGYAMPKYPEFTSADRYQVDYYTIGVINNAGGMNGYYTDQGYSQATSFGYYFTCYLDCDYTTITFDQNNQPVTQCTC